MEHTDGVALDSINNLVSWYQQKIAAYDKQLWEKSVEQKVLKGINKVPRKSARVRQELIDVDLVRGSTFTKEKPQYSWLAVSTNGVLRVVFMPLFIKWWSRVTSWWFALGLLGLYSLQVAASIAYTLESEEVVSKDKISDQLSSVHITVPWCMMVLLGMLQSHISATRASQKSSKTSSSKKNKEKRDPSTKTYRRKSTGRSKSRDSGSQENGADVRVNGGGVGLETEITGLKHRVKRRSGSPSSAKTDVPKTQINEINIHYRDKSRANRHALNLPGLAKNTVENSLHQRSDQPHSNSLSADVVNTGQEEVVCENKVVEQDTECNGHVTEVELDKAKVRVTIVESGGQMKGFQVIRNDNGLDESCSNDSGDEGLLCGNSQEDPASLDGPLPESVGTIFVPNGDNSLFMPGSETLSGVGVQTGSQKFPLKTPKKNEQESPSEAGSSESGPRLLPPKKSLTNVRPNAKKECTFVSSCESDVDTAPNTPVINKKPVFLKTRLDRGIQPQGQTSEMEWEENAMNSEVSSSDSSSCSTPDSDSDDAKEDSRTGDLAFNHHLHNIPSVLNNLASSSDKVSCMIWEEDEVKKVDLTVLELGWTIIQNVDRVPRVCDYLYFGFFVAVLDTVMPLLFRIYHTWDALSLNLQGPNLVSLGNLCLTASTLFGSQGRIILIVFNSMVQRLTLSLIFFFLLSVAERTFKQRLLYAKHFCYLTSSRRARKYQLPHFRLNKVRNIKTWLSLRSYLKKRGPQRSVDIIVSAAFLTAVFLMSLMSVELLNDNAGFLDHIGNWELILWCFVLAIYLLRFMTLGTKINKKYRNFSVLITEQINLYLHMELKPHKKEELMRANSVLKLAEDLLKELESPFKISGLSANPILYNVTKVVILSAFSAILTELLGFKLKLYKIKFRG